MPVTLRKRLECHYCGKRLNTTKREGDRIPCEHCSADNFFDASNNIIDVPQNEVIHRNVQHQTLEIESDSDVFCKKCLTNQAFFVQALANYLPDEDDPQYEMLLSDLPAYEKDLELRYPQCCPQCEPRAAARIQEANYMAKSDHLRRVIHRKHDRRISLAQQFPSLLISAAGLGQATSLGIQLLWHALSSQMNTEHITLGITPVQCLTQWPVPTQCTHYVASLIPTSLVIGLLCIWWNPKWQHRLQGREGRLVGLSKFYQMQLAILAVRFVAWAAMEDLPALQRNANVVHTVLLVLLSITFIYATSSIVKVDTTPLVDWHQVQRPLVQAGQFRSPQQPLYSPPSSQENTRLSIADLAGPSASSFEPWRPPTPPTEDDSMDWAPTQHVFDPQPRIPKPKFEQPNPFYGTLPAAPARGSFNPKARPAPPQRKALGLPPGFFGLSKSREGGDKIVASQGHAGDAFAPAKFFPNKREADTGLESIFDKMFSVRDHSETQVRGRDSRLPPKDIFGQRRLSSSQRKRSRSRSQARGGSHVQPPIRMILSCSITIILAVIATSLCSHEYLHGSKDSVPFQGIPYIAAIPVAHLLEEGFYTGQIEIAGLVVSAMEVSMAVATNMFVPINDSEMVPMWNRMVIGVVCFFMLQEIYHFCQLQGSSMRGSPVASETANSHDPVTPKFPVQQHFHEETTTPRASIQQHMHMVPTQIQRSPFPDRDYSTVRKRDSDESISSVSSINTTSTASGWKTPQTTGRTFDWQSSNRSTPRTRTSNSSLNFGGLSLGNDFGSGANIAGPRNRQMQGNGLEGRR